MFSPVWSSRQHVAPPPSDISKVLMDRDAMPADDEAMAAACVRRLGEDGVTVVRGYGTDTEALIQAFEVCDANVDNPVASVLLPLLLSPATPLLLLPPLPPLALLPLPVQMMLLPQWCCYCRCPYCCLVEVGDPCCSVSNVSVRLQAVATDFPIII